MKTGFTQRCIAGFSLTMLMLPSFAATTVGNEPVRSEVNEERRTKRKNRMRSSRSNDVIRIYPDLVKRVMHVAAKELEAPIDFFAFDLEGTLVAHFKMESGGHEKMKNMERGKYIYRVFSGDVETATGNFEIR